LYVALFIMDNIANICGLHGYRWMHVKCIQSGIVLSRETVRLMMHIFGMPK